MCGTDLRRLPPDGSWLHLGNAGAADQGVQWRMEDEDCSRPGALLQARPAHVGRAHQHAGHAGGDLAGEPPEELAESPPSSFPRPHIPGSGGDLDFCFGHILS